MERNPAITPSEISSHIQNALAELSSCEGRMPLPVGLALSQALDELKKASQLCAEWQERLNASPQ